MKILVVGSINIDETSFVKRFPSRGETVISSKLTQFSGGKGANQAIAAKRLSYNQNDVMMFAKVGNDDFGKKQKENLDKNKVNSYYVKPSSNNTGKATIIVSEFEKNNMIIISKGANSDFGEEDLHSLKRAIERTDFVLVQLETNNFLVEQTLKISKKMGKITFLNPAPAEKFNVNWLKNIDWFFPNETELEFIANDLVGTIGEIESSLDKLRKYGLKNAVVTLGKNGVFLYMNNKDKKTGYFKAVEVETVDTTAAGDTFIGAFVGNYGSISKIENLIKIAIQASAMSVTKRGAQDSIPTVKELEKWKKQN